MGPARFHCATLLACSKQPNIALLQHLTKKKFDMGAPTGLKNFVKKQSVSQFTNFLKTRPNWSIDAIKN